MMKMVSSSLVTPSHLISNNPIAYVTVFSHSFYSMNQPYRNHRIYYVNCLGNIASGCGFYYYVHISLIWTFGLIQCVVSSGILCLTECKITNHPFNGFNELTLLCPQNFVFLRVNTTAWMMFDTSVFDKSVTHGGRCGRSIIILYVRRA